MYSLMLMTAMAGAPDATAFGGTLFGGGCSGCSGVSYLSCSGSSYGSYSNCYGGSYYSACTGSYYSSCTGCCGGYASCGGYPAYTACCGGGLLSGLHSRLSGLFHGSCSGYAAYPVASCQGSCCGYTACCGGSCSGSSSSYYYGSCHGYSSGPYYSVYGGCYSTCSGGGVYGGCYGTFDMSYPAFGGGCGGGCGGVIVAPSYSPVVESAGVIVGSAGGTPAGYYTMPETGTSGYLASAPTSTASGELPARLAVELPASARLYVDGTLIRGDGETRHFHTPDLVKGKAFYYELRAEFTVAGKVEVEEKKVVVRAGDRLTEAFPKLLALVPKAKSGDLAASK